MTQIIKYGNIVMYVISIYSVLMYNKMCQKSQMKVKKWYSM